MDWVGQVWAFDFGYFLKNIWRRVWLQGYSMMADILHFDDRFHTVEQICLENGFGYENFNITTEDGYILRLDRVLPTNKTDSDYNKNASKRPVVLLQHGIQDSSVTWVINSPDKAVAF